MATAPSNNQDLLMCPICLDLLRDPVTIFCGHNYCMKCIRGYWDREGEKGVYSCPQCRQTSSQRPVLNKNNAFAELVDQSRNTKTEDGCPDETFVECDVCIGRKLKAVKSCLDCLVSCCEIHFKAHNEFPPSRKHSVIDATDQLGLQKRICSRHKKVLEIFCRTDQTCICYLCMLDEHKGHDTISAAAEWSDKLKQLGETQRTSQQRIQEREKELQELKKAVDDLKRSAQTTVMDCERIFAEVICSIEKRRSEVIEQIKAQEKAEVSRAEGLLEKLEQEIAELKRRDAELEQLSHTQDHIHFLKHMNTFKDQAFPKDPPSKIFNQDRYFELVKEFVSSLKVQLEGKLDEIFRMPVAQQFEEFAQEFEPVAANQVALPQPVTRQGFRQYLCHLALDPNTAHPKLRLSERNRTVEHVCIPRLYPDHPDRFDKRWQVFCKKGVSERCYWEIEWDGTGVDIAISYKGISRKGVGDECVFGLNDQSWRLDLSCSKSSFWHKKEETKLPLVADSRIGVYVDHRAGILAFYSISDQTMTLLHKVKCCFTHPVYPGFGLYWDSLVKLL